jgi:hypothetical protein
MATFAIIAFLLGLVGWFIWGTWADWRLGRVPAAMTLGKVHYARRSDHPVMFWGLTTFRIAFGALLIWRVALAIYQLLAAR